MRLLTVLFILTSTEADRRRFDRDQVNINRRTGANNVDVYPERFEVVDFGHVYKNGDRKQTSDIEPDIDEPRSLEHARELLKKIGSDIVNLKKPEEPSGFSSPRDLILYNRRYKLSNKEKDVGQRESEHNLPLIKNITQSIRKAVEEEIAKKHFGHSTSIRERLSSTVPPGVPSGLEFHENNNHKAQFFSKSGFDLVSDEVYRVGNWTTCKEFGKGAVFHPDDVVNMKWVPFFIWSTRHFMTSIVHTLTYPTKKLVKQYREEFGPYLNMKLDWEQPKLLLNESKDILLIAGDRKGLFYGIPYTKLPSQAKNLNVRLTVIIVRLKIVDPYLALMYCNDNYATIMGVEGTEPETDDEKTAEAAILNFRGVGHPATRDLELENHKTKFEIERKRREEENKYIKVERPDDTLDPSLW